MIDVMNRTVRKAHKLADKVSLRLFGVSFDELMTQTDHECADNALSECCGAEMHGDVSGFCGGCNEFSSFECSVCEKHVEGW
jgi:hydrogenase maturation factor HypE